MRRDEIGTNDLGRTPAVCDFCGEAMPHVFWAGFSAPRMGEALALCDECAESVCGGLLLDVADHDMARLDRLIARLRDRLLCARTARARVPKGAA